MYLDIQFLTCNLICQLSESIERFIKKSWKSSESILGVQQLFNIAGTILFKY